VSCSQQGRPGGGIGAPRPKPLSGGNFGRRPRRQAILDLQATHPPPTLQTKKQTRGARHTSAAFRLGLLSPSLELAFSSTSFPTAPVERTQVFHVAPTARSAIRTPVLHPPLRLLRGYQPVKRVLVSATELLGLICPVMFRPRLRVWLRSVILNSSVFQWSTSIPLALRDAGVLLLKQYWGVFTLTVPVGDNSSCWPDVRSRVRV